MSKSAKHHSRDRRATDALRKIFPKEWHFKSPRDVDSGREYSEDWIIEIVDDDEKPTEIEFGIQNKTDVKITKKHVSVELEMSDVQRLLRLKRLILIHAYHIDSDTSYWTWLDEWYPKYLKPEWKYQKTVTVTIPLDQVLDNRAVDLIRTKAWWDHEKRQAEKLGELMSQSYPEDYQVSVQSGDTFITTIINPKHEGAIPTVQALDEETWNAISTVRDLGIPAQPTNFSIAGLPSIIFENISTEFEYAIILPISSQKPEPLRIEFLNGNDEPIFRSLYVLMSLIQPGQIVQVWAGRDDEQQVTYIIETNL